MTAPASNIFPAKDIFKMVTDRYSSSSSLNTFDPGKHEKIKLLADRFLDQFSTCTPEKDIPNHFTCSKSDSGLSKLSNGKAIVDISTYFDPKMVSIETRPEGFTIATGTLAPPPQPIPEAPSPILGFRQAVHEPMLVEESISCSSSANEAYHCLGNAEGFPTGKFSKQGGNTYSTFETTEGRCYEAYSPSKDQMIKSNCKDGLPLFDQFLNQADAQEISTLSRAWSYAKLGSGITGTLYFGYKTYQEIQKIWNGSQPKSQAPASLQRANLRSRAIEKAKAEEQNKTAMKNALIYGTLTAASLAFSAYTYYADFVSGVFYNVLTGNPSRF